jgi:hypothetical protein
MEEMGLLWECEKFYQEQIMRGNDIRGFQFEISNLAD